MPSAQPDPQSSPATLVRDFITSDPSAAEFLLALLSTAAFSPRFGTLLNPLPTPSRYYNPTLQQPDIALLRADLASLPPLRTLSNPATLLPPSLVPLLSHTFFHANSSTPWLVSAGPCPHFPASDLTPSRRALRFAPVTTRPIPPALTSAGVLPAFHGSPPERWYSILRNGLIVPDDVHRSNGRLFGDAAYLASSFALAASFAPHECTSKGDGLRAMSVVGEFDVATQAARKGDVPDGYVVVEDVAAIRLTALSVLLERKREQTERLWVHQMARSVVREVARFGFVPLAVVYLLVLLLIGRR